MFKRHFDNLQLLLQGQDIDDCEAEEEDFGSDLGPSPFSQYFENVLAAAEADMEDRGNPKYILLTKFIRKVQANLLPQAPLWTSLLLGDLDGMGQEHRVEKERWKKKEKRRRGVYVAPRQKPFTYKNPKLQALWRTKDTEVVIAVIPSQLRGQSFTIRHSELKTLCPHQWLVGEVIESLMHHKVCEMNLEKNIYVMSHYIAGVILHGKREEVWRQTLRQVNFDTYSAVVSFVNTGNVHWKLLMAEALLEAYPEKPKMTLRTTETCMVAQRTRMALTIIKASGM
ncbi:hypothetical protein GBF38_003836 [Nibea albiflora]|uniref:Uncharacterized protein n=1 Tax=Nibea albiflora TaxID=240163 RepID=A0ACB7FBN3_NIBAL|nr:hypothetical protein GBF38_003836 [Nibea albiflora]